MTEFTWITLGLFLHVLVAIAGIGPMFVIPLMDRLATSPAPFQSLRTAIKIQRTYVFALLAQLLTGAWLMLDSKYDEILGKQMWLHTSFLFWLIAGSLASGFNLPRSKKALAAAEAGDASRSAALLAPVEKFTGPAVAILTVLIVLLMVWKPVAS